MEKAQPKFLFTDSIAVDIFKCSLCGWENIIERDNYCSGCGAEIEWEISGEG